MKPEEGTLFRGWLVLGGLFLLYCATNGILVHSLPLLYPELIEEFGWTEVQVTLPATVFYVVSAFTSPPAGVLLDKFPAPRIILCGALGIIVSLVLLGSLGSLWQMVAIYVLIGTSLSLAGLVSNMLVLSRWFDRYRGRAIGILLMASSLGGVVFPQIMGFAIEGYGWRVTVYLLAAIATVMMLTPLLLLIRNSPAEYGLRADGAPADAPLAASLSSAGGQAVSAPGPAAPVGITLAMALRQKNFYLLALATAAVFFSVIALTQHQSIYLGRDLGVPGRTLATVFSLFFGASVIGKLLFGFLSDKFRKDWVMVASIIVLMSGLGLLQLAEPDKLYSLYAYALVAGVGFSGAFTCIQVLVAMFYAGPSFGKILAVIILCDTLAGALGTRVVGLLRESSGSYTSAFNLMIAVCFIAIISLVMVRLKGASGPAMEKTA